MGNGKVVKDQMAQIYVKPCPIFPRNELRLDPVSGDYSVAEDVNYSLYVIENNSVETTILVVGIGRLSTGTRLIPTKLCGAPAR